MSLEDLANLSRDLPQLDLGQKVGYTHYIDFLKEDDVPEKLMGGTDVYGRPFITFKGYVDNTRVMETIFQRYTSPSHWMSCGHGTPDHLLQTSGGMKHEQIQFYLDLFEKGETVIEEKHRPSVESWIGKTFTLSV